MNSERKHQHLGNFLKNKRQLANLTQSEVASQLGYGSPQFISNIERGISSVPLKSLKSLVRLYKIDDSEIIKVLLEEKRLELEEELKD